jgi:hypothetical protein
MQVCDLCHNKLGCILIFTDYKSAPAGAQKVNNTYSYTIENKTISITYTEITVVGTINNNKMTVNQNNITAVFVKQ